MCFHWYSLVNRKGKTKNRARPREFGNGTEIRGFYDDEINLVQNNGRVTLPSDSARAELRKRQTKALILLGASILMALLIGRK